MTIGWFVKCFLAKWMSTIRHFVCCCACVVSAGWSSRLTRLESSADDSIRHHHPCFHIRLVIVGFGFFFLIVFWPNAKKMLYLKFQNEIFLLDFVGCSIIIGIAYFCELDVVVSFGCWNTLIHISLIFMQKKHQWDCLKLVGSWLN